MDPSNDSGEDVSSMEGVGVLEGWVFLCLGEIPPGFTGSPLNDPSDKEEGSVFGLGRRRVVDPSALTDCRYRPNELARSLLSSATVNVSVVGLQCQ